jgi:hypothetical protein
MQRNEMRVFAFSSRRKPTTTSLRTMTLSVYRRITAICNLRALSCVRERTYREDSGVDEGAILSRLVGTLRNEIMQYVPL